MTILNISNMKGKIPRVSPKLLQNNEAQEAINCDISSGKLIPLNDLLLEDQVGNFILTVNSTVTFSSSNTYNIGDIIYSSTTGVNYICLKNTSVPSAIPGTTTGNEYWSNISIYVIDDDSGTQEDTTITCDAASYLVSSGVASYLTFYTPDINGYIWFNITDGSTVDPGLSISALSGYSGIQVDLVSTDTNTQVATKLKNTLDTYTSTSEYVGLFSSNTVSTADVTLVNKFIGASTDMSIGTISGGVWAVVINTQGTDADYIIIGGGVHTIYNLDGNWLSWSTHIDIVKSTIPDNNNRIYFTGDEYPKQTNTALATSGAEVTWPTTVYRLGVPAPTAALTASINATGTIDSDLTTAYVYTYVTAWGEEGAPSPPSNEVIISAADGESVDLTGFISPSGSNLNLDKVRIYRVNVGDELGEYQLVNTDDTLTLSTAISSGYNDNINPSDLGEVISTTEYTNPPDMLEGIVEYNQGVYAAFKNNDLYFSEPFKPYAWPASYNLNIAETPVGLGVYSGSVIVCTETVPSIIQGNHPSTMIQQKLPYLQPCLSQHSITSSKFGVTYASPDGLFTINDNGGVNLTENIYSREQWNSLDLANLHGTFFDGKYYGFFETGSTGFIFDYEDPTYVVSISLNGYTFITSVSDGTSLYILLKDDTTLEETIYKFDEGTSTFTYTWKSKKYQLNDYKSLSASRIICSGDVTFKLYIDGSLVQTKNITNDTLFRLPAISRGKEIEFQLEGTAEVDFIQLATSVREITNG